MTPSDKTFWRFAVLCSKENGLRLSDIMQLQWSSFTHEEGKIVVWTEKTNARVVHNVSEELKEELGKIIAEDPIYLFPKMRAMSIDPKRRAYASTQFKRMLEHLGIHGKSFHCLRHYFCCSASRKQDKLSLAKKLADNFSIGEIQTMMGHASPKTTRGYLHEEKV